MKISRKSTCLAIVAVAILSLSLITAGCIGSVSLLPSEVQNHGNTIYLDPNYVSSATIGEMLLNPNGFEQELFETVDTYLPRNQPVVDVGVGTGALMAYVSKKLAMPKQQIAVEPNPYLIPSLKKTLEKNSLVIDLHQAAIAYNQAAPYVPLIISKELSRNVVSPAETTETVNVPVTTIRELIDESMFANETNITLIVETSDLLKSIFENEEGLKERVEIIIGAVPELKENEFSAFLNIAYNAGYDLKYASVTSASGITTYVFKRNAIQNLNDTNKTS